MHFSLFRTFVHAPVHIQHINEMVHKNNQDTLKKWKFLSNKDKG